MHGLEQLRMIAVTGYAHDGDRKRTRAAGFENHLVKPVNLDTLDTLLTAGAEK
jgi:two-component system CheB/CheR fusion protein